MSDSAPAVVGSPDCETPEEIPMRKLAGQLRDASIHLEIYHPTAKGAAPVLSVMRTIAWYMLMFGDSDPEGWRVQLTAALDAAYYKTGCCTWRD